MIVPVLFFLHAILKQTPKIPNWLIPWILTICGMGFAFYTMMDEPPHVRIMQGMIATAVVVFGTTLVRDTTNGVMNGNGKNKEGKP